ncbi:serine protease [Streptomyces capparidis]
MGGGSVFKANGESGPGGRGEHHPPDRHPWRVRLRRPGSGELLGSGVLLGGHTVLTCAHAVTGVDTVQVELPEIDGEPPCTAEVVHDRLVPEHDGDKGDLALLRLHRPQPADVSASLLRTAPSPGTKVHLWGYPKSVAGGTGTAFDATVSMRTGERVQLNPATPAHAVRHGFSGGPVLDLHQPASVLGITATGYHDEQAGAPLDLVHMIPVDTVVKYLPEVRPWVTGRPGVEPGMVSQVSAPGGHPAWDAGYAERLAAWLRGESGAPGVRVTEVVRGSVRDLTLQRALALADREMSRYAPAVPSGDPPATVPPVGSLDLAVDARGATADEVVLRIAERLNFQEPDPARVRERLRAGRAPLTVAVLGMNLAADPPDLLRLCGELADCACRQLLVWYGEGHRPDAAVGADLELRYRMGDLARRVDELTARSRALARDAAGLCDVTPAVGAVTRVAETLALFGLARRAGAELPQRRTEHALTALGERAEQAGQGLDAARGVTDERRARRERLRADLESSRYLAVVDGPAEDTELEVEYRAARDQLYHLAFDEDAARLAVTRYTQAVRRRRGWTGEP